ncbi:DUF11 domain-containing protein [Agreia sp. PsM10]|uniref:DUF11 domain-containing protein n=1 Tax=Agreia sp. PsM10 TaxID=3030533 RepID=UPI00263B6679|nr:DUF11 domain-containing protein [Agreia sp. PsM10]MDN4640617.1 DUF11 domain-containing protein [Agreia sp. PsM10]
MAGAFAASLIGLSLMGAGPAIAAPQPILPDVAAGQTPVQIGGSPNWVGYQVIDSAGLPEETTGNPWPLVDSFYTLPKTGPTTLIMQPRQPDVATGYQVPPANLGPVSVTVTPDGGNATLDANLRFDQTVDGAMENGRFPAPSVNLLSDGDFESFRRGGWTLNYDFTSLPGGSLPAGSLFKTLDVDVCGTPNEGVSMTSSASGEWLNFDLVYQNPNRASNVAAPITTFDPDTSTYAQAPNCGDINMSSFFSTTQDLTNLTVHLQNASGAGWVYFTLYSPSELLPTFSIVKDDETDTAYPGQELTYNLDVTNTSASGSIDVPVSDALPESLEFVSASDEGAFDEASNSVLWTIPSLAAGEVRTLQVTVRVAADAVVGSVIENTANVTAPTCAEECVSTDTDTVVTKPVVPPTQPGGVAHAAPGAPTPSLAATGTTTLGSGIAFAVLAFLFGGFLVYRRIATRA